MISQQKTRIFKKRQREPTLSLPPIRKRQKRAEVVPVSVKKVHQQTKPKPPVVPVKKPQVNDETMNLDAILARIDDQEQKAETHRLNRIGA